MVWMWSSTIFCCFNFCQRVEGGVPHPPESTHLIQGAKLRLGTEIRIE